jgi:hypothetical protein
MHRSVETRDQREYFGTKSIRGLNNTTMREGSPSHPQQEHGPMIHTRHTRAWWIWYSPSFHCVPHLKT